MGPWGFCRFGLHQTSSMEPFYFSVFWCFFYQAKSCLTLNPRILLSDFITPLQLFFEWFHMKKLGRWIAWAGFVYRYVSVNRHKDSLSFCEMYFWSFSFHTFDIFDIYISSVSMRFQIKVEFHFGLILPRIRNSQFLVKLQRSHIKVILNCLRMSSEFLKRWKKQNLMKSAFITWV